MDSALSRVLAHHVQGVEFVVVAVVEPRAPEVVEQHVGSPCERERIDHELLDRLHMFGVRFIVEDVHLAVPDLHDVNVAGVDVALAEGQGNIEAKCILVVADILIGKDEWYFDGDRGRVVHQHEFL